MIRHLGGDPPVTPQRPFAVPREPFQQRAQGSELGLSAARHRGGQHGQAGQAGKSCTEVAYGLLAIVAVHQVQHGHDDGDEGYVPAQDLLLEEAPLRDAHRGKR